jgi:hypothetical protein
LRRSARRARIAPPKEFSTMKPSHVLAFAALSGAVLCAQAQTLKPGLWDVSSRMEGGSPQMQAAMGELEKQMAAMSPQQRKQMQDMMARQGVSMGSAGPGGGVAMKICFTKEMVERNDMPTQQGDCTTTKGARTGNTMKVSFKCTQPPSSGEGEYTFVSSEAFTSKMTVTTNVQGKPETMKMSGSARFLAADCGNIKPPAVKK